MKTHHLSPLAVERGLVWGWACVQGQPQAEVHLWCDGRQVAAETTGVTLPKDVLRRCGTPPPGAGGFAFALPAQALDGLPHDLHAGLPQAGEEGVHGEVLTFRSSPQGGQVTQQGRQYVGTVYFEAPQASLPLLLVKDADGKVLHLQTLVPGAQAEARGYPAAFGVPCGDLPEGQPLHFWCGGQELGGSPLQRGMSLVGMLEEASPDGLSGWAFDGTDVRRPIELAVRVDGRAVGWFRPNMRRPEIARQLRQDEDALGLVGFSLRPPEALLDGQPHLLEIVAADGGLPLTSGQRRVQFPKPWRDWHELPAALRGPVQPAAPLPRQPSGRPRVSLVVLNRNGEQVLQAFLDSWARHNRSVPAEIIVVDHASTDGSLALLERWRAHLDIQVIALDHNGSFSESSNRGARQARGEYLLFMNNDIVWLQDALPRMLESLQAPDVGIVGLKLLKVVGESHSGEQHASEVQHLGVRFKLNEKGYWPYEAAPSALLPEAEHTPQAVPAVTGAVLLCRKADFEAVGGFDPAYFYGFEDVELCLRLAYRLGKQVVSRNDCTALHRHGHTRLSGREMSIFDRLLRNSAVLQAHVGLWTKQAYWRSLLQGDGYVTREALTIGVVVDASPAAGEATPLLRDALALAAQLRQSLPHARLVLLEPARGWKNVAGLHVLVVGDAHYDIRSLQQARADLLTVAWPRGDAGAWAQLPWWSDFGAEMPAPARGPSLGSLLATDRWRLRIALHLPVASEQGDDAQQIVPRARQLQAQLRQAGLPCWPVFAGSWSTSPVMADVCITLWPARPPRGLHYEPATDVLNVVWLLEPAARAPRGAACNIRVTRSAPTADWLAAAMEERIGNTFSPS